jgi:hypothetical protein
LLDLDSGTVLLLDEINEVFGGGSLFIIIIVIVSGIYQMDGFDTLVCGLAMVPDDSQTSYNWESAKS